jgi:hypothetical protein
MGDEVIWETLLDAVPSGEDLSFVSGDTDYTSSIETERFNPFLEKEWLSKKDGASIKFYKTIQDFFKINYPEIRLASDVKKITVIESLATSGSFYTTHLVIAKLHEIEDFSPAQAD